MAVNYFHNHILQVLKAKNIYSIFRLKLSSIKFIEIFYADLFFAKLDNTFKVSCNNS